VNPFGDEVLEEIDPWWGQRSCAGERAEAQ
jgi:hypothetical protein